MIFNTKHVCRRTKVKFVWWSCRCEHYQTADALTIIPAPDSSSAAATAALASSSAAAAAAAAAGPSRENNRRPGQGQPAVGKWAVVCMECVVSGQSFAWNVL